MTKHHPPPFQGERTGPWYDPGAEPERMYIVAWYRKREFAGYLLKEKIGGVDTFGKNHAEAVRLPYDEAVAMAKAKSMRQLDWRCEAHPETLPEVHIIRKRIV